jgi:hypothetical protein
MLASAYTLLVCLLPAAIAFKPGFPYGAQKVRGVSIGGWLLIEVRVHAKSRFISFPLFLLYALCVFDASFFISLVVYSRGLLPAYSTTRVTTTLSMNGRLGSCKTEILRNKNSRSIGTHG